MIQTLILISLKYIYSKSEPHLGRPFVLDPKRPGFTGASGICHEANYLIPALTPSPRISFLMCRMEIIIVILRGYCED